MRTPNKSAAANSHRPFSFDQTMKFGYHFALLSPPPVAVAELDVRPIRLTMSLESIKSKLWASVDRRWRSSVWFRYLFPAVIVFGTIAIITAVGLLTVRAGYAGIGVGFMLVCGGCFILIRTFLAFRKGVFVVGKFPIYSIYERREKPLGFWFYTFFFTVIGTLVVTAAAVLMVIYP